MRQSPCMMLRLAGAVNRATRHLRGSTSKAVGKQPIDHGAITLATSPLPARCGKRLAHKSKPFWELREDTVSDTQSMVPDREQIDAACVSPVDDVIERGLRRSRQATRRCRGQSFTHERASDHWQTTWKWPSASGNRQMPPITSRQRPL